MMRQPVDCHLSVSQVLPQLIPEEDLRAGCVYPRLHDIREISTAIACAVLKAGHEEVRWHCARNDTASRL